MERKSDEALNCCKIPIFNGQCTSWEDGPNYLPFSKKYLRSLDLFSSNGKTADITPKENEDTTNLTFRSRTNSFPQTAKTRNNKQHAISEEIDRLGLTAESVYGDKKSEIDENESNLNENNDSRFSTGYTGSKLLKDVQNVTKYSSSREDNSSKEKNAGEIRSVNIEKKLSEYGHFDILDINNIAAIPRKSSTSTALQKAKGCNRYQDTLGLFWMNEDTLPLSSPMMDRKVNTCSAESGWSSDPGDPQKIRHNKRLPKKSAQNQIAGERSNVGDTKSIQVQPENEQSTIDIKKGHITKIKHSSNTIETNNSSKDQNLSNIKTFKNKTNIGSKHMTAEHHDSGEEDIHEHTSFQKQTLQWVSTSKVRQSRREHNMLSPPTF